MSKQYINASSTPTIAGIQWHESYGCYRAKIAGWLELTFSWDSSSSSSTGTSGYRMAVNGVRLKAISMSAEDAAVAVVEAAKRLMAKALKELS